MEPTGHFPFASSTVENLHFSLGYNLVKAKPLDSHFPMDRDLYISPEPSGELTIYTD